MNVKVKELKCNMDDLQSELELKSRQIETLKSEKRLLTSKYIQLKGKEHSEEKDTVQTSTPDSLIENDPEVFDIYNHISIFHSVISLIHSQCDCSIRVFFV